MALINRAINEVTVKLVYYGPGLCGKTTNLEAIYGNPRIGNKGKMISMSTEADRTLFFDFMPMELGTIGGQKVRVQLYTVPGQVFYDATRKLVLRGADGVVFVADSQVTMADANVESLANLEENLRLNRLDPAKIPIVFQYNKRDLPNVSSVESMSRYLRPGDAPVVEASAIDGTGVAATLREAVSRILENLRNGVDIGLAEEDVAAGGAAGRAAEGDVGVSAAALEEGAVAVEEPFAAAVAVADDGAAFAGAVTLEEAAAVKDAGPEPSIDELLASTRGLIRSLETLLESARAHETLLLRRLGR
jgi:mutual gliding-motility protein MglA